jgi:hypothetical protein
VASQPNDIDAQNAPGRRLRPALRLPTPAIRGHASLRVVVRPAAIRELRRPGPPASLVAFAFELGGDGTSALPAALPPPAGATVCLVLISAKLWRRVASALEADPEDALVIDGYAGLDPLAPRAVTLRATEVTTTALLDAKRAAQGLAREPALTRDDVRG